jgi:hypothetical protein
VSSRVGHRPAEAEGETELDEFVGLLAAAVEGMGDPAAHLETAQLLEYGIDGPPHVEQDRQIEIARQPGCSTKKCSWRAGSISVT